MEPCKVGEYSGPHLWTDGIFAEEHIETCRMCGIRRDGKPWIPFTPRCIKPIDRGFFFTCPYIIFTQSQVHDIRRAMTYGCGGYGEVSWNHPAAAKGTPVGEASYCQRCHGTGVIKHAHKALR